MMGRNILLVGLFLVALVSMSTAQICKEGCKSVPSVCSSHVSHSQYYPLVDDDSQVEASLQAAFAQIDALELCGSCTENLKLFLCSFSYPSCETGILGVKYPQFPKEENCEQVIDSCIPTDAPDMVKSFMRLAFEQIFQQMSGASSCSAIYNDINELAQEYGLTIFKDITVAPQSNCACRAAKSTELNICADAVNYNVWSALLVNGPTLEQYVAELTNATIAPLTAIPGVMCDECKAHAELLFCTQFFPSCDSSTNQLFIPPCKQECDDLLHICRLDQIDNTTVALLSMQNVQIDLTMLNEVLSMCDNETLFTTDTPCTRGNYPLNPPRCPCASASSLNLQGECKSVVTWEVPPALVSFASEIETLVGRMLTPFSAAQEYVCENCTNSVMQYICSIGFPKCDDTALMKPPCGSCEKAIAPCKLDSMLQPVCDTISSQFQLPETDKCVDMDDLQTFPSCGCIPPSEISLRLLGHRCASHVNYAVSPAVLKTIDTIKAGIDQLLDPIDSLVEFINCPSCIQAINRVVCQGAFPQCDDDDLLIPMCKSNCDAHVATCGIDAFQNKICNELYVDPFKDFNVSRCFTTPATNTTCSYCQNLYQSPSLKNCGQYVDWDVLAIDLPGFDSKQIDTFIGSYTSAVNMNCTKCVDQIKRTICSIFLLPCNKQLIEDMVLKLLSMGEIPTQPEKLMPAVSRPCLWKCEEVFSACLSTAPPGTKLLFSCSTNFPKFPVPFFSTEPNCYVHEYPPLPPPECPILQPPPGQLQEPESEVKQDGGGNSGAVIGAVVGVILGLVLVAVTGLFLLWYFKKWVFAVPKPPIQPPSEPEPYSELPQRQTWSKHRTNSVELKNVK